MKIAFFVRVLFAECVLVVGVEAQPLEERKPFAIEIDPIADIEPIKTQHTKLNINYALLVDFWIF